MKKVLSIVMALSMAVSLFADVRRIYCKMEHGWWYSDGAVVAAHYWGRVGATSWPGVRMTPVDGSTTMWYIDLDDTNTHIIFVRVSGTDPLTDWGAKTADLTIPSDNNNLFTINSAGPVWGDPGCTGAWSYYENVEPTLWVDVATYAFLGESVALNARSENVTAPVYTYSVKVPEATDFTPLETNSYKPEALGEHTFRVTVAESTAPATVLAEVEKTVMVRELPEPITVKVKVPAEWGTTISLWCWDEYDAGHWLYTTADGEWYTATLERLYPASFIVVNGSDWPSGDNSQQTVDVMGITASGCYEVGAVDEAQQGKRVVTSVDCGEEPGTGTGLDVMESHTTVLADGQGIQATFDGTQRVQLYSVSGQLLHDATCDAAFAYPAAKGIYLLRIGGEAYKVAVK